MKKWFCALGMMLALLMSVALADGVKVTFAEKNGQPVLQKVECRCTSLTGKRILSRR